ncbi:HD domain-containing phosphohydrolase [Aneurinibacillus terranovensis]|uniref:HD domain-containing phosphohydrolase n=1 Tax=Aneurinibacillus terranovensis TaxID=278991 RepID=UPI000429E805|nr:HD domain-containing phosphohydrolase [Aneurinibacillus terranovensis]
MKKNTHIHVTSEARQQQLDYSGVNEEKLQLLNKYSTILMPYVDRVVESLYNEIYQVQELRNIINRRSTLEQLKLTQKQYLLEILAAKIDDRYIQNRYLIGKVHFTIGLGLQWYIATYAKYLEILSKVIEREIPEESILLINALQAVFSFDTQIVLESYNRVEMEHAVHPLRYEMDRIRHLIGFTDEDLRLIDEFSGFISFRVSKIIERFWELFSVHAEKSAPLLMKGSFDYTKFRDFAFNFLLQFFQDKIYMDLEAYHRVIRDWSRLVLDGTVQYPFYFVLGECLNQTMRDIFLNSEADTKMYRFVTAFEKLMKFTISLLQDILKPYQSFQHFKFLDIYACEISVSDFGRITWVDESMQKSPYGAAGDEERSLVGKRCYQVIRQRNFPCTDCAILTKSTHATMFLCTEHTTKALHTPQNEIFGLSHALLIIQDKTRERKMIFDTLDGLLQLAEFRDDDTGAHVYRIGMLSEELARLAGCDESFVKNIRTAAQFHDIGKVGIPDSILNKPGKLTPEEREYMQTHAQIGYQILANMDLPIIQMAARIAQTHHEWWNGKGYPSRLKGEDIPLEGRIVAIVDVFDALLSKRVYKEPFSLEQVRETLLEGKGTQFDPRLIDLFLEMWDDFVEFRFKEIT